MKTRAFERVLRAEGCALERQDADHHIWRLPNGRRLLVPVGGKHSDLKPYVVRRYRRLLKDRPGGAFVHGNAVDVDTAIEGARGDG